MTDLQALSGANYTRDELIAICEQAVVPVDRWRNRDSASAQEGVGHAWALLKAGAEFQVITAGNLATTDRTIWIEVDWPGFMAFEYGTSDRSNWDDATFYLPTPKRLAEADGKDWY